MALLIVAWVTRTYPEYLGLRKEVKSYLILNFVVYSMIEWTIVFDDWNPFCWILGSPSWFNLLQLISFQYCCLISYAINATDNFPLPLTSIFDDFEGFFFNTYCFPYFYAYIQEKEPENCIFVEQIMDLYLGMSNPGNQQIDNNDYNQDLNIFEPNGFDSKFKVTALTDAFEESNYAAPVNRERETTLVNRDKETTPVKNNRLLISMNAELFSDGDVDMFMRNSVKGINFNLIQLRNSYQRYRLTRSFRMLYSKISDFEQ